jgi:hypothetical protein
MEITNLTPQQLRKAADLQERIQSLQSELVKLLGGGGIAPAAAGEKPKRQISASGRARIAAAARARWARTKSLSGIALPKRKLSPQGIANIRAGVRRRMAGKVSAAPIRKMSAAARAHLAAVARARWAKARAQGKSAL